MASRRLFSVQSFQNLRINASRHSLQIPRLRPHVRPHGQSIKPQVHVRTFTLPSRDEAQSWLRNVSQDTMRKHPIMFPVMVVSTGTALVVFLYTVYLVIKVRREMGNYPPVVGAKLRRARYYTDFKSNPAQALKDYLAAIQAAQDMGMDPLSDEVIGIWVEMARCYEKHEDIQQAIDILNDQRKAMLSWIESDGTKEGNFGDRTRILQKAIQFGHKIGELYSHPKSPDKRKAGEYLTWSVETMLWENQRRRREGLRPGEGGLGLDPDQQGANLEDLGHYYESRDNFYFAGQLFLQALNVKTRQDCHTATLMNNIAAALAQQNPVPEPGLPAPTQAQLRENAVQWALKAVQVSRSIKDPKVRTSECDRTCAAAVHNLGEFAEMDGNIREARERYEEAGSLAHAASFEEGVIMANEGLKRLKRPAIKETLSTKGKTSGWW